MGKQERLIVYLESSRVGAENGVGGDGVTVL